LTHIRRPRARRREKPSQFVSPRSSFYKGVSNYYAAVFASYLIRIRFPSERVLPRFYWAYAQSEGYWAQANSLMTGGGQPQFNGNALGKVKVPVPPIDTQQAIVAEIEAEHALVNANRDLIARFEKKIEAAIARVWGSAAPETEAAT
jgi:type I restriction enzyme M protein